jgi:hypothetical protein
MKDVAEKGCGERSYEWLVVKCKTWPMELFTIVHGPTGLHLTPYGLVPQSYREGDLHIRWWTLHPGPEGSSGFILSTATKDSAHGSKLGAGPTLERETTCAWEIVDASGQTLGYTMSWAAKKLDGAGFVGLG